MKLPNLTMPPFYTFVTGILVLAAVFWLAYDGPEDQLTGAAVYGLIQALTKMHGVKVGEVNGNDE